eukprot:611121-Prorocentrum_minimum.AAC.1
MFRLFFCLNTQLPFQGRGLLRLLPALGAAPRRGTLGHRAAGDVLRPPPERPAVAGALFELHAQGRAPRPLLPLHPRVRARALRLQLQGDQRRAVRHVAALGFVVV